MQSNKCCINTSSADVEADPCSGLSLTTCFLPEEVLIHLLSFVDPDSLVFRCRSVCRQWRDIITDSRVWKLKIPRSNVYALSKYSQSELKNLTVKYPWYLFYWVLIKGVPFERNLLQNNCGQKSLEHWVSPQKVMKLGEFRSIETQLQYADSPPESDEELGDGEAQIRYEYDEYDDDDEEWLINEGYWNIIQYKSSDTLPESEDFENNLYCFTAMYSMCSKEQLINLSENGFPHKLLDQFQPSITISEWYAGQFSCDCLYRLNISLLDEAQRKVIKVPTIERTKSKRKRQGAKWTKVSVTIKKYGPGLRYIRFQHAGMYMGFCIDRFGTRMAGGVIRISLPEVKGKDDEVSGEEPSITII